MIAVKETYPRSSISRKQTKALAGAWAGSVALIDANAFATKVRDYQTLSF